MVLTMAAPEITPCGGYGEGFGAWIEMEKWFLLYRVNVVRAREPVDEGVECAGFILAHTA
jgi:hypothetical protein